MKLSELLSESVDLSYSKPITAKERFYDFYVLSTLPKSEEYQYWIDEARANLIPYMRQELLHVFYVAILGEINNADGEMHGLASIPSKRNLFLATEKFIKKIRNLPDIDTMKVAEGIARKHGRSYVVSMCDYAYRYGRWEFSYGGKSWADVTGAWMKLNSASTIMDSQVWIDHIFDVEHNNGNVLGDLHEYSEWIEAALEEKRYASSPYKLIDKCSLDMQKIAFRVLKDTAGTTYEQWRKDFYREESAPKESVTSLRRVLSESDDYEFYSELQDAPSRVAEDFYSKIKNGKLVATQPWDLLDTNRIKKIFRDFSTMGIIRDEAGVLEAKSLIVQNVMKLYANTILMGHKQDDPEPIFLDAYEPYQKEHGEPEPGKIPFYDLFDNYIMDPKSGQWRISDYGLDSRHRDDEKLLIPICLKMSKINDPRAILLLIDRAFNVVHQRSDLSSWFVRGGAASLDKIFSESKSLTSDEKYAII